ncbi:MAG: hypothetical protein ACR2PL_10695, partial [Dehalococcoidia bacterium]
LQSIGGAVGLGYLFSGWRIASIVRHPGRLVWSAATLALLLAALVYPVAATFSRTNGFTGQRRLDGLAYWQSYDPSDYVAARWLAEHSEGSPVLVEAEGPPLAGTYSLGGRISGLSGLPTILGWRDHAVEFHPNPAQVAQRAEDIRTIYRTNDPNLATALLDRYHVRFVVVGGLERQVFPDSDFVKFARLGAAVYQRPGITIYDMTEPPAAAGGSRQSGWTWQRAANSRDNRSDIASSGTVHPYRLPSASNQSEHGSCGMTADCRLAASEASIGG